MRARAEPLCANLPVITRLLTEPAEAGGKRFALDHIQPPEGQEEGAAEAAQQKMYEMCAHPAVEDVLRGYNGTIFAYGQVCARGRVALTLFRSFFFLEN